VAGEIDLYADLEAVVMEMRRTLARATTIGACGCGRTEREHAIEGATALLEKLPWAMHSVLAAVMLADLHEAAPVAGFDLN
jgi:hypothetical protein